MLVPSMLVLVYLPSKWKDTERAGNFEGLQGLRDGQDYHTELLAPASILLYGRIQKRIITPPPPGLHCRQVSQSLCSRGKQHAVAAVREIPF